MNNILKTLDTIGINLYRQESYIALYDAERNLSGRTHYVDAGTLKYFGARINVAYPSKDGLLYVIRESVAHPSLGRIHRCVAFDVFGEVLTPRGEWLFKTSAQAIKAFESWRVSFDAEAHTLASLTARMTRQATQTNEALTILGAN